MTVVPVADATLGGGRRTGAVERARLVTGIVGLVLLIACANVANLVLARGHRRQPELAVRYALGAARRRLVRQLMTESLLLSFAGALAGLGVAWALGRFLVPLGLTAAISGRAAIPELRLDVRVLGFALVAAVATGLLFGLVPALRASRPDLVPALKAGGTHSAAEGGRVQARDLLVVAQVAGSIVLLIGAGLFVRSLHKAYSVDLGFDPEQVLLVSLDMRRQGLDDEARLASFYRELVAEVESLPGVRSAAIARAVPVSPAGSRRSLGIEGYQPADGEDMEINFNVVSAGYFATMGIPILRGRPFTGSDGPEAPKVAVVNRAFAERYWPGESPIGKQLASGGRDGEPIAVVGLTATGKYRSVREDPLPYVYFPLAQQPASGRTLAVRARSEPTALLAPVRERIHRLRPALPLFDARTLMDHQGRALAQERTLAVLVSVLGFLTLLIAAVGVYGVMSNAVSQRIREIGIRAALGARAGDVAGMILAHALRLSVIGVAAGAALAWVSRGWVAELLFGITASDPLTFAAIAVLLVVVAVAASVPPAWRAAHVDPMVAVRDE